MSALLASAGLLQPRAVNLGTSWVSLAIPIDRTRQGRVDRDLNPSEKRQPVCHDLKIPAISRRSAFHSQVAEEDIGDDTTADFSAHSGLPLIRGRLLTFSRHRSERKPPGDPRGVQGVFCTCN
jgi:hypothetical protein